MADKKMERIDNIAISAIIALFISFLATPIIGIIAGVVVWFWLRKKKTIKIWLQR